MQCCWGPDPMQEAVGTFFATLSIQKNIYGEVHLTQPEFDVNLGGLASKRQSKF